MNHRALSQEELAAIATGDRVFDCVRFSSDLALKAVDLSESTFTDCRFEPMRLAGAKFAKARFTGCSWFDAEKRKGCTFAFCDLQSVEIAKGNLATCRFERCDLYDLTATDSSFRGAQFHQSTFSKTISRRSTLTKASFERCNLSFADLSGLLLQNCAFRSCKLSEASFIDTDLSEATLIGCALDRIDWERAKLRNADLRGSDLSGLNLALLADYAGLKISDSEQAEILGQLGVDVHPSSGETLD
jgi:fluoroquinolone resistance protein